MNRPLTLHLLDKTYPPDPRVDGELNALEAKGQSVKLAVFQKTSFTDMRTLHIKRSTFFEKLSALAYTFPFYHRFIYRGLKNVIEQEKPTMLHVHDMTMARGVQWISRKYGIPYILDLHENRPEIMKHYSFMKKPLARLLIDLKKWKKHEKRLIQSAYKTVVVTKEARDWYVKNYGVQAENFVIVPNTVDEAFIEQASKSPHCTVRDALRVLYIGDTGARRGLASLIEAIAILKSEGVDIECTILGAGRDDPQWEALVKKRQLEDCVHLEGWVNYDRIHQELSRHNVGVCPILSNVHHDTTYANKLFQYMAYGLVNVVSDCTAQANLIRETVSGVVHEPGNAKDLAAKLRSLLEHPSEMDRFAENGQKTLKNQFSKDQVYADLIHTYRSAYTA
jgi:glycosyltransferase involved in cell wall biosynthesis